MSRITGKRLYDYAAELCKRGLDVGISGAYGGWLVTNKAGGKELFSGHGPAKDAYQFMLGLDEGATQVRKSEQRGRIDRAKELLEKAGLTVEVDPVNPNWSTPAYDARVEYNTGIEKYGVMVVECPSRVAVADFLDDALACFWGAGWESSDMRHAMDALKTRSEERVREREEALVSEE